MSEKSPPQLDLTGAWFLHLRADGAPTRSIRLATTGQIQSVFADYRDKYGLGASDMGYGCGNITNEKGHVIAKVAYNGRIFVDDKPLDGLTGDEWIQHVIGKKSL
jgi:hypothetical protein